MTIDDASRKIAVYKSVKCKRVFRVYKKRHVALPRSPQMVNIRGRTLSL
jgi:hypothetical protein